MIGPTIRIKGSLTGEENLVIEGTVEGSVELTGHDLTIGAKGQVDADLNARTVKVEGRITGDITGSEKVIISKSGKVLGNIVAPRVTLEDGAKFKGSIDMDPGETSQSSAKRAAEGETPEKAPRSAGNASRSVASNKAGESSSVKAAG